MPKRLFYPLMKARVASFINKYSYMPLNKNHRNQISRNYEVHSLNYKQREYFEQLPPFLFFSFWFPFSHWWLIREARGRANKIINCSLFIACLVFSTPSWKLSRICEFYLTSKNFPYSVIAKLYVKLLILFCIATLHIYWFL